MTRFNEWIAELERATNERLFLLQVRTSLMSNIIIFDIRKYKFVQVGPKPRFAVAMDGTIYGTKNNNINKKECYGNVDTFEEFDWTSYYPVRKALYDWQVKKETAKKTTKARKKTSKLAMARQGKAGTWTDPEAIGRPRRSVPKNNA